MDWNREGEDPALMSDAVGEAPSLENEVRCESELPSSPWSRENRRIFSWGVSRSLRELGIRSSSNFPRFSSSSQSSFKASGGRAPTLEDIMPLGRFATISECMMRRPVGCPFDSGGDEPNAAAMLLELSPNAESCRFLRAGDSPRNDEGGDPVRNFAGTDEATGPYRAMCDTPWLSKEAGSCTSMTLRPF